MEDGYDAKAHVELVVLANELANELVVLANAAGTDSDTPRLVVGRSGMLAMEAGSEIGREEVGPEKKTGT